MKVARHHLPSTVAAVRSLGSMVAEGRRTNGWTAADLAARLGVSVVTLRRIENGEPSVAIGLAFEAAVLCGVELFSTVPDDLERTADQAHLRLSVLPSRVRRSAPVIDDDF